MRGLSDASSALERSTWTVLSPVLSMQFFSCLLLDPSGYFFTVVLLPRKGSTPHDSRSLFASHLLLKLAGDTFRNCTIVRTVL
jgi:hypothetical protein